MKKVSIRAFQLKPSDYLDKLPIVLTRYRKVIAVLNNASDVVDKVSMDYIERKIAPQVVDRILREPEVKFCKHGKFPYLCEHQECRKT